jgi:hypothetical protein
LHANANHTGFDQRIDIAWKELGHRRDFPCRWISDLKSSWSFKAGVRWDPIRPGVYQALHEASIEPDWIIGTSIGAINACLIGGNAVEQRLSRLE